MGIQRFIPVSDQIENILLERVRDGVYSSNTRFPSESQLCAEFGVSRATIRTTLTALSARGLLIKKPGVGTFLTTGNLLEGGIENLESVLNMAKRQGLNTQVKDISVEIIEADDFLAERLVLPGGARLTSIRRTIAVNDIPVSYHEDFVPIKHLAPEQVNGMFAGSVLDLISQKHFPPITCADTEITTAIADKALATTLNVPVYMALILLKESLYDEDRTIVSYSKNYFIPDRFRIRVLRRKNLDYVIGNG